MIIDNSSSYHDWKRFGPTEIPSSIESQPMLFEKLAPGDKIVDIGCGFGRTCFDVVARGLGPITGIDINAKGIEHAAAARGSLPAQQQRLCRFDVSDATKTTLATGYYDAAILQAVLTTLTDDAVRRSMLREVGRIVRSGGGLYLADFVQTWHHPLYRQRYKRGEMETGESGSFNVYNATGEIEYRAHHYTERELVEILEDGGFEIETLQYTKVQTRSGNVINGAIVWAIRVAARIEERDQA